MASPGPAPAGPAQAGLAAVAAALVVLAATVRFGGSISEQAAPGLTQAGAFTKGALALSELAMNAAGALTAGWLLLAAVLLPAASGHLERCLRAASLSALAWTLAVLAVVAFSTGDLFGVPAGRVTGNLLATFLTDLPQGRALVAVAVAAATVAVTAPLARTPQAAGYPLLLALAGLLPPMFTGHAADASFHALAVYSLAAHVLAAAVWAGGLVALAVAVRWDGRIAAEAVARYSAVALVCFAVVAVSGAVNAWIRLGGFDLGSRYGALIAAKAAVLAALAGFGWRHRRASIPRLRSRHGTGTFLRLAAAETVVMAAAMALATGLSRTPPPELASDTLDPVQLRLGFPLPGPPSVSAYALDWWIDPLFGTLVVLGGVLYAAAVVRLRGHGGAWPPARVVAWYAGLTIVLVATSSGLARYSMVLFSAHLVQHMVVTLLAPVMLWLGAPVALALRALPEGRPRELVAAVARSRGLRLLTHPVAATALLAATLYGFYFTPLFEASLRNHAVHSLAMAVFLASGCCYLRAVTSPGRGLRAAAVLAASLPFHVAFALHLAGSDDAFAAGWFTRLGRPWGVSPLADQRSAGEIVWTLAAAVTLLFPAVLASLIRMRSGYRARRT
ncbi:copper resistance protein D [Actinomadura sp. NBRC 104425]|nr:copper resistance protein D [Actinomadura sp. NBRC 104425]